MVALERHELLLRRRQIVPHGLIGRVEMSKRRGARARKSSRLRRAVCAPSFACLHKSGAIEQDDVRRRNSGGVRHTSVVSEPRGESMTAVEEPDAVSPESIVPICISSRWSSACSASSSIRRLLLCLKSVCIRSADTSSGYKSRISSQSSLASEDLVLRAEMIRHRTRLGSVVRGHEACARTRNSTRNV